MNERKWKRRWRQSEVGDHFPDQTFPTHPETVKHLCLATFRYWSPTVHASAANTARVACDTLSMLLRGSANCMSSDRQDLTNNIGRLGAPDANKTLLRRPVLESFKFNYLEFSTSCWRHRWGPIMYRRICRDCNLP
jgi:hypothetical protein